MASTHESSVKITMFITQLPFDTHRLIFLNGRLDATASPIVSDALDDAIRAGQHRIFLDCQAVDYISSVGIRTLLQYYKQLKTVDGTLSISNPSPLLHNTLVAAGLADLFFDVKSINEAILSAVIDQPETQIFGNLVYTLHSTSNIPVTIHGIGDPNKAGSIPEDLRTVHLPRRTHAVGLGYISQGDALGEGHIGEVLATDGIAIAWHTGQHTLPDHVVIIGDLVPNLTFHSGIIVNGEYENAASLDVYGEDATSVPLTVVLDNLMSILRDSSVAFTLVAEVNGVIGAAMRTPLSTIEGNPFSFPAVQNNVYFTTERTVYRQVAIITGVATRDEQSPLFNYLRPMGSNRLLVHIHAAVFPYSPVPKGHNSIYEVSEKILAHHSATAVLHCLDDDRAFDGLGETEVIRGAVWFSPIDMAGSTTGVARR